LEELFAVHLLSSYEIFEILSGNTVFEKIIFQKFFSKIWRAEKDIHKILILHNTLEINIAALPKLLLV